MHFAHLDSEEQKEQIDYKATFKLIYRLLKPYKKDFFFAFCFLTGSTVFTLLNPIIAKHIIDVSIQKKDVLSLVSFTSFFFINAVLIFVFDYLLGMRLVKTGQKIIVALKRRMLDHIMGLGLDFYSSHPVGTLTARIQSDTSALYDLFTNTVVPIFQDMFTFIAVFSIMAFFNLKLTLLFLPFFPVMLFLVYLFVRISSPVFIKTRRMASEITYYLTEQLNGTAVLQAYNRQKDSADGLYDINRRKFNADYHAELYGVIFFTSILFLQPAATATIFGVGGGMVLGGKLSVGVLVMFILYITQLFEPIMRFTEHVSTIQRSFSAGHRITRILAMKPSIEESQEPVRISSIEKDIEFRHVWMKYKPEGNWILKDISFRLEKGRSLAIAGETGGGKTTITNLLFRFYEFQKGEILIDGRDIRTIEQKSLRSAIGLIQQDIYLFPGTIMDNLKMMDKSISDERVFRAIKLMELDSFFRKHPLNKKIVEKGANLSIGEKQVIALARALILNQEILVLDEATSHMDPYTEQVVTNAVNKISEHKTLIIIAHRLSTIKNVDRIMMVSEGELKESGTHGELMAAGGLYSKYYKLQYGEGGK